jgi:PEP-CTERM motif/RTX calcium-binding nonapeptide repeat (4 copies)
MIERNRKPARSRGTKSLLAALIANCIAVAPATAGTIGIDGNTLVIGAEPSDVGVTLTAFTDPTHFSLMDPDGMFVLVTPGLGCDGGPMVFSCLLTRFTSILVIGSAGDDVFEFSGVFGIGATFAGGAGDDNIAGTQASDIIYGGIGDDILRGDGSDSLFAGPGVNDIVLGGPNLGDEDPQFDPLPRPPASVPEPGSLLLLLAGLGAAAATRYRGKRRALRYC